VNNELHRGVTQKQKRSRGNKKPSALRRRLLVASAFVPLGVEVIRLIEQLLKPFTH